MDSLLSEEIYKRTISRINALNENSVATWGTMSVAQMCAHLNAAFEVPLRITTPSRMLLGLIFAPLVKQKAYDDSKIGKNLKTVPSFVVVNKKEFLKEQQQLIEYVGQFHGKAFDDLNKVSHPFFGKLTTEQWGKGMYKHVNHHLEQFAV